MSDKVADRRASQRVSSFEIVTLLVGDGPYRGSCVMAMTIDISAGGICVLLDGGVFSRGTAVQVLYEDGLHLDGWISHSRRGDDLLIRSGISFNPFRESQAFERRSSSPQQTSRVAYA